MNNIEMKTKICDILARKNLSHYSILNKYSYVVNNIGFLQVPLRLTVSLAVKPWLD